MPLVNKVNFSKTKIKYGSSFAKLFNMFSKQKWVFILIGIFSFIEAAMVSACDFIICLIYNNFILQDANVLKNKWLAFVALVSGMMILYLISQISFMIHNIWMSKISENVMWKLRKNIIEKLHALPIRYFDIVPSGQIMSRISSDVENISQLTSQNLASIIFYISLLICNTLVMFFINWYLSIITYLAIPIIIIINFIIVKYVKPSFTKQQNAISNLNGYAEEKISGTKIISLFKMQDKISVEFDNANRELTKNSLFAQAVSNILHPIVHFLTRFSIFIICSVGVGILLYFGWTSDTTKWLTNLSIFPKQWTNNQSFSPVALLLIFTMCARNFAETINSLVNTSTFIFLALASAEKVFEILHEKQEQDMPFAKPLSKKFKGNIETKNLSFCYDEGKFVLRNINLKIKAGQTIAIVGPTGAGKTTFINLMTKFYDNIQGDILFDRTSIKKITRDSLRKNIAIVTQDTFLFAESIWQNLKYGNPNATNKEIIAAAKATYIHDFIMQLPNGYDTILHDNGTNLSEGQRQLLSIARALLAKPKIVILDEATSRVDTKTELLIGKTMDKLTYGKTSLIIAHRLSTIVNADKIIVINDGKIIEQGKHAQLLAKHGFYYHMYDAQFNKGKQF